MISTGSILLGIALLLIVGLVVLRPLLSPSAEEATFAHAADPVTMRQALEAQKDALLEQIRDLDFDRETGKVPEDRYRQRRAQLTTETADIFRQLDALAPAANGARPAAPEPGDKDVHDDLVDDEIEATVARLRKGPPAAVAEAPSETSEKAEAEIEAAIARLRSRQEGDGVQASAAETRAASHSSGKRFSFCPQCGESHEPDDKFCAFCGHGLV